MKWKDITTYAQSDTEKKPSALLCLLNKQIEFKVHKHIYYGDEWLLSCKLFNIDMEWLGTEDLYEAKTKAAWMIAGNLELLRDEISNAIEELQKEYM